jgi:hypothetical protein
MKKETDLGRNRTGMGLAPKEGDRQEDNAWKGVPAEAGDEAEAQRIRGDYASEADPVGSVAPPPSLKGMVKSALQAGLGRDPAAFLDKLGERMAFERSGARLYELLITKHQAGQSPTGDADLSTLIAFRDQEVAHFRMLWECIEKLGADPTVQTPSADHTGVKSMGLLQTLADPRTSFYQSLDAILIAELADREGWRMLSELAEEMGHKDLAALFLKALEEEDAHLDRVRAWWAGLVRSEVGVAEEVAG